MPANLLPGSATDPAGDAAFGLLQTLVMGLTGAVACWAFLVLVLWVCGRRRAGARAGEFHHAASGASVPRYGGLALVGAFVVLRLLHGAFNGWDWISDARPGAVLATSVAMFAVGFWDDLKPLGARKKLLLQIIIALAAYGLGLQVTGIKNPFTGEVLQLQSLGIALTVLWLVAMTNLINLVDGIDGLAGGVSLMLMCLLAYVSFNAASLQFAIAIGMAGALLVFLRFNFPPARIYMGDGGAYFLGFLIGALTIASSHKGTVLAALIAPVIALGLPIIDTATAILRRGLTGLPLFRADRKHIHHRLLQRGLSRTKTVLFLYAVSVVFLLMAFAMFWTEQRFVPIVFGLVFLCFLFVLQGRALGLDWVTVGRVIGNSRAMRRHTQYVMALACWLEMEAERKDTLEGLWDDYLFMARKVGCTRVKIVFSDSHRAWTADGQGSLPPAPEHVFEFNPGVRMLVMLQSDPRQHEAAAANHLSELLAEAWVKAASRWAKEHSRPLTFNAATPLPARPEPALAPHTLPAPASPAGLNAGQC
jgi:UDP-GlcNAc:undecaprenyl-phosphate GlcNAc-1-phosphate transferase